MTLHLDAFPNFSAKSIYFGGGTPSLYPIAHYQQIFEELHKKVTITDQTEISIECDPNTFDHQYIKSLKALGFNRISLGIQNFDPSILKLLNRSHSLEQIIKAIDIVC